MSTTPTPLVPYDPTYADIYTDVERSIQQTLKAELVRRNWSYYIFVNQVDEKEFKNQKAALGIMKGSDVPDHTSGGGQGAFIKTATTKQPWAQWFSLVYQMRVTSQTGVDMRNLDSLIRYCFPPRTPGGVLWLWDSVNNRFTTSYCTYEYAGYVNRDVPPNNLYDRITNMRFQVPSYTKPAVPIVQITDIDVTDPGLDFELSVQSGS